jgi:hypothetical protein
MALMDLVVRLLVALAVAEIASMAVVMALGKWLALRERQAMLSRPDPGAQASVKAVSAEE